MARGNTLGERVAHLDAVTEAQARMIAAQSTQIRELRVSLQRVKSDLGDKEKQALRWGVTFLGTVVLSLAAIVWKFILPGLAK